ncbi:MAG: hypothetical protein JWN34_1562 [Bryobacterales bacterium]|nr:hypothetical protein [Bryobacterales bacterium]
MRRCFVAAMCLVAGLNLFGQTDRGTVTGTITDPANAVMQGAKVSLKSTETGATYDTVTTGTGNYTLPSVPSGSYDLTVESAGFNRYIQTGINVQVAQTARIDVVMKVGATTDSVTVNADAPLLKTESAEQSQTITGDRINALPLTSSAGGVRNPIAGVILAPGVYSPNPGSYTIRVNGGLNNTYKTLMDGQDITTAGSDASHLSELNPSADALQEVSLQSSNFAAEFGQVAGGLINMTSRSGTNQYHGSGYEYFTNEALNAGRAYTNTGKNGTLQRPRSRNNDFGFTVGGPLSIPKFYNGHDKTFFFFNMEEYRTTATGSGSTTVPTDGYRNGDFSDVFTSRTLTDPKTGQTFREGTIFDPATTRTVNGNIIRDPFPGNVIPANRFDPVAVKIQALIPKATLGGVINNLGIADKTARQTYIPSLKVDHYLSSSLKFSVYLAYFWQDVPKSGADGLPYPISAGRNFIDRTPTIRLSVDKTVTPTFLVHLGLGEVRYDHVDSAPASVLDFDAPGLLGLTGAGVTPSGFPRLNGLVGTNGGISSAAGTIGPVNANRYTNDKPTVVWSGTLVHGSHTFKSGGEWRRDIWSDVNTRGSQGIYNFDPAQTGLPYLQSTSVGGGSIGFSYASFLLGLARDASTSNKQDPQIRKTAYGLYWQDTWKVSRKLTLDYGLRWDYEQGWKELYNRTSIFGPSVVNPSAGGLLGGTQYEGSGPGAHCNCRFAKTYPFAFGPRLGAAYQLNSKTVLRGGWGIVYGRTADGGYITNTPLVGVGYNTLSFSNPAYGEPGAILRNGLTYNRADLNAATFDPGIQPKPGTINSPPFYIDPSAGRPSRINQWTFSLQREITKDVVVEVSYVGNRGAWLQGDRMQDWNGLSGAGLLARGFDINNAADRTLLTSPLSSAAAQADKRVKLPYATFPAGNTVAQSLRPYPQFGTITTRWTALGNSWYDALQAKVNKRFSHGFDGTVSFSWQKESSLGLDAVNDAYNREQNKYVSAFSQPLVLAIGFNYESPAVTNNRLVRAVARGWTFSGIGRYSSGLPIQSPNAQNNLKTLLLRVNGLSFATRVPGVDPFLKNLNCHCVDPNKELVLNPAAWTDPAPGQFGTAAAYYNDYRQQRRPSEQVGFGRIFHLRESMSLQLRAEFFNVFNRTQMNNPTSNNAKQATVSNGGIPSAGFGFINSTSLASAPRSGQLIARFRF